MSKNTIFKSIVVFFVALLSMSTPCHACWDEYDDDYYDYDSYDDWDDWDEDWDYYYESTWFDEVECVADRIDDESIWFDEVECVADRIDDDDDYNYVNYFPDSGYDNYNDDDNSDFDYDSQIEDEGNIPDLWYDTDTDADNSIYIVQSCEFCCVPAVMAIMDMIINDLTIEQAYEKMNEYIDKYSDLYGNEISDQGIHSNEILNYFKECGFETSRCTVESIQECTDHGCQVFVFTYIEGDDGNEYGHALDVIDSHQDSNGDIIYTCINPATGLVEEYRGSDFNPEQVFCVKGKKQN